MLLFRNLGSPATFKTSHNLHNFQVTKKVVHQVVHFSVLNFWLQVLSSIPFLSELLLTEVCLPSKLPYVRKCAL